MLYIQPNDTWIQILVWRINLHFTEYSNIPQTRKCNFRVEVNFKRRSGQQNNFHWWPLPRTCNFRYTQRAKFPIIVSLAPQQRISNIRNQMLLQFDSSRNSVGHPSAPFSMHLEVVEMNWIQIRCSSCGIKLDFLSSSELSSSKQSCLKSFGCKKQ